MRVLQQKPSILLDKHFFGGFAIGDGVHEEAQAFFLKPFHTTNSHVKYVTATTNNIVTGEGMASFLSNVTRLFFVFDSVGYISQIDVVPVCFRTRERSRLV